ncbi:MAG: hypothetical protein JSV50_06955, partial [Desulfobacteraceae bacterium]
MRAFQCGLILMGTVMIIAGCVAAENETVNEESDKQDMVVQGNNKFALDLYSKLQSQDGNLFFSPYSISTALAMTYA